MEGRKEGKKVNEERDIKETRKERRKSFDISKMNKARFIFENQTISMLTKLYICIIFPDFMKIGYVLDLKRDYTSMMLRNQ